MKPDLVINTDTIPNDGAFDVCIVLSKTTGRSLMDDLDDVVDQLRKLDGRKAGISVEDDRLYIDVGRKRLRLTITIALDPNRIRDNGGGIHYPQMRAPKS